MEKELIEYIARSLVEFPDKVEVNVIEGEKSIIIELAVAETDIGQIIGRQGRIAKAMRTILSSVGSKQGKRFILEILD